MRPLSGDSTIRRDYRAARVDYPDDFAGALDKARASGLPAVIDVRTDAAVASPQSFGPAL